MSRIVGRAKVGKKEFNINQCVHATETGYEVQDVEKRAEYEKAKKEHNKNKTEGD